MYGDVAIMGWREVWKALEIALLSATVGSTHLNVPPEAYFGCVKNERDWEEKNTGEEHA